MLVNEVDEGVNGKPTSYDGSTVGELRMVHPDERGSVHVLRLEGKKQGLMVKSGADYIWKGRCS